MAENTIYNSVLSRIENQASFSRFRTVYSERIKPIVVWGGAGLSTPAGLPTWSGLRDFLQHSYESSIPSFDDTEQQKRKSYLGYIRNTDDQWLAFQLLEKHLGASTFRALVREKLACPPSVNFPPLYEKLWELNIDGFITLNLDRFAFKSIPTVKKSAVCEIPDSTKLGSYLHVLNTGRQFIANLHGILDDSEGWIFTKTKLLEIQNNHGYRNFLNTIFSSYCVVFIGISADDAATGGFLRSLSQRGLDLGEHFWITSRRDQMTEDWAQNSGIQAIRYPADDMDHEIILTTICDRLRNYVPQDKTPSVITGIFDTFEPVRQHVLIPAIRIPTPIELAKQNPEYIRQALAL